MLCHSLLNHTVKTCVDDAHKLPLKYFYEGQAVRTPRSEASWEHTLTAALDLVALDCTAGSLSLGSLSCKVGK